MATDDQIYESNKVKAMTKFWIIIALILTSGAVGGMHLFLNRPFHPEPPVPETKPLVSAEECTKMCGETGIASYDVKACTCNPPKKPGLLQVDKMDCNCACVPMTWRQQQNSENKEVPQQR